MRALKIGIGKIVLLLSVLSITGCIANKLSYHSKGEQIEIKLINNPDRGMGDNTIAPILASLVPETVNIGIKGVNNLIDNETKKYTQKYKAEKRDKDFYYNNPSSSIPNELNYSGFSIIRKVTPVGEIEDTASKIEFEFVLDSVTQAMLAIKPKNLRINSTKAKLRRKDSTIDITIKISLKSFWVIESDKGVRTFNSKELLSTEFSFKNLQLGLQYNSDSTELKKQSSWFSALPYSKVRDGNSFKYDKGIFELNIEVVESDDMEKRLKKISKKFKSSEELLKVLLKEVLTNE